MLSPSPDLFFRGRELLFSFCEGEGDCTKESAEGQFSIFGAIEEKEVCGFVGRMRVKKNLSERGQGAWSKRFWSERAESGKNFWSTAIWLCTGLAQEMQKVARREK
jgi:hypothetical protein